MPRKPYFNELTPVELMELKALARDLSAKEAAQDRWVSEQTVKYHRTNL